MSHRPGLFKMVILGIREPKTIEGDFSDMDNVVDYKKAKTLKQIQEAASKAQVFRANAQRVIDGILSANLSVYDDEEIRKIHENIIELQAVLVRSSAHVFQRLESRVRALDQD